MVKNCSAFGCTNRIDKRAKNVHFHRIPINPKLRRKWVEACGRHDWSPGYYTYLCSDHFHPSSYKPCPEGSNVKLRRGAVPTIFTEKPPVCLITRSKVSLLTYSKPA